MPQIMARIRAAGAGLSIDDFGTGASTLSEFRNLPVDTVKIDKSFLARHGGTDIDTDGEVVLSGIVAMAHELKRAVVAEGVESEADAQFLARIGCEFGQGYYFSPALDGAAALDYIARHYNIAAAPELGAEPCEISSPQTETSHDNQSRRQNPLRHPDGNAGRQAHARQHRQLLRRQEGGAVRAAGRLHARPARPSMCRALCRITMR